MSYHCQFTATVARAGLAIVMITAPLSQGRAEVEHAT